MEDEDSITQVFEHLKNYKRELECMKLGQCQWLLYMNQFFAHKGSGFDSWTFSKILPTWYRLIMQLEFPKIGLLCNFRTISAILTKFLKGHHKIYFHFAV